jgi:hypothetical protein
MNTLSVSAIDVVLEIRGKVKLSCQFKRHLSPTTVGLITRSLPLEGNVHHIGSSIVYIETEVNSGIERKKTNFKNGDIAFLPAEGSICFFVDDVSIIKPMTPIGRILGNLDVLRKVKVGDILSLYTATG